MDFGWYYQEVIEYGKDRIKAVTCQCQDITPEESESFRWQMI